MVYNLIYIWAWYTTWSIFGHGVQPDLYLGMVYNLIYIWAWYTTWSIFGYGVQPDLHLGMVYNLIYIWTWSQSNIWLAFHRIIVVLSVSGKLSQIPTSYCHLVAWNIYILLNWPGQEPSQQHPLQAPASHPASHSGLHSWHLVSYAPPHSKYPYWLLSTELCKLWDLCILLRMWNICKQTHYTCTEDWMASYHKTQLS